MTASIGSVAQDREPVGFRRIVTIRSTHLPSSPGFARRPL